MRAMILAAGRGSRLRPLTDTVPKPLVEVAGQPLIVHHLRALCRAGIAEVVINLGWLGAQIRSALGDGATFGVRIVYSDEGQDTLETAGGIVNALPLLGSAPFLLINADVWIDLDVRRLAVARDDLATLVLVPNPPQHRGGDFTLDDAGRVGNPRSPTAATLTYAGVAVISPRLLADHPAGRAPLAPVLRAACDAGKVGGVRYAGLWSDVGTAERLDTLRAALAQPSSSATR